MQLVASDAIGEGGWKQYDKFRQKCQLPGHLNLARYIRDGAIQSDHRYEVAGGVASSGGPLTNRYTA
jgi:hypothetical protein